MGAVSGRHKQTTFLVKQAGNDDHKANGGRLPVSKQDQVGLNHVAPPAHDATFSRLLLLAQPSQSGLGIFHAIRLRMLHHFPLIFWCPKSAYLRCVSREL